MKVTAQTDDLLIVEHIRWVGAAICALATLISLGVGVVIAFNPDLSFGILLLWLSLTVVWLLPLALLWSEKSTLVFNAQTAQAELRHRDIRGLHRHTWPLDEVQSTRVTRPYRYRPGPAHKDPHRIVTLFVREGMDEGRHKLTHFPVDAEDALSVSSVVSDWMKAWRQRVDSQVAKP